MNPLANHLWQSTIFAVVAIFLTWFLKRNRAQTRYWLWLAASVKFLVPIAPLIDAGRQIEWRNTTAVAAPVARTVEQISQPFTFSVTTVATPAGAAFPWTAVLLAAWPCGCAVILSIWFVRWRRIRAAVRAASPVPIPAPIPVMSCPTLLEPGVFGVFRPVLLLPDGITRRLTPPQLKAILSHELCHVRRRDNLASALHMAVEAVFWFHPLVWWIGARLVAERERACDEEVLRQGSEPYVYAEGILNVAKFCVESSIPCVSGVTGADLRKRIEEIMTNRLSLRLTFARKVLLAAAGIAAVAGPIAIGIVKAQSSDLKFEVATIKPSEPGQENSHIRRLPGEGLNVGNQHVMRLITFAYDVRTFQVSGAPAWLTSDRYDIVARPERFEGPQDLSQATDEENRTAFLRMRQRVRALLAERFQLAIHKEAKEFPIYALVVAKGGHKLRAPAGNNVHMSVGRGRITADGSTMQMLAESLSNLTGRTVRDQTGLQEKYDFKMEWTPDQPVAPPSERPEGANPPDLSGPSLFTAIQEQLGLRLESNPGPSRNYRDRPRRKAVGELNNMAGITSYSQSWYRYTGQGSSIS